MLCAWSLTCGGYSNWLTLIRTGFPLAFERILKGCVLPGEVLWKIRYATCRVQNEVVCSL